MLSDLYEYKKKIIGSNYGFPRDNPVHKIIICGAFLHTKVFKKTVSTSFNNKFIASKNQCLIHIKYKKLFAINYLTLLSYFKTVLAYLLFYTIK